MIILVKTGFGLNFSLPASVVQTSPSDDETKISTRLICFHDTKWENGRKLRIRDYWAVKIFLLSLFFHC